MSYSQKYASYFETKLQASPLFDLYNQIFSFQNNYDRHIYMIGTSNVWDIYPSELNMDRKHINLKSRRKCKWYKTSHLSSRRTKIVGFRYWHYFRIFSNIKLTMWWNKKSGEKKKKKFKSATISYTKEKYKCSVLFSWQPVFS